MIQDKPVLAKRAAQAITGLNMLILLGGLALAIRFDYPRVSPNLWPWVFVFWSLNAIVYSLLALLILTRHPAHTVGWLLLITGFFFSLAQLSGSITAMAVSLPIHSQQVRALITLFGHLVWVPWMLIPITLILQFFPNGRLLSTRWWPMPAITILGMIGMELGQAFTPWGTAMQGTLGTPNPWAVTYPTGLFDLIFQLSLIPLGIGGVSTWAAVGIRFKHSRGVERTQMKWLIYSAGLTLILLIVFTFYPNNSMALSLTEENTTNPIAIFILPILFPIGLGLAILRHGLWDIDIVIQRTLVYGVLTVLIISIYITIVGSLGILLNTQINTTVGLIATAVIAVLFQPLRDRLQYAANRLLFGERDDPTAVLNQLAQQMEMADSPTAILPNLVHTIAQTLKLPHVAIWLPNDDGRFAPVAHVGQKLDQAEMIALTYQNKTIGHLAVAPRSPSEPFNRQEQQLLNTIAVLTANTVRAVQLSDELRHSRQRIVSAREEERRRLRRDLHDGLGPQLASQTLGLEVARQIITTKPEKAAQLLAELETQTQEAVTDIRRLVYDLRPPALDDLGLVGALQQSAARYETGTLQFIFEIADSLPALPAAVEIAAYRITQEALTNIVRHAQATCATVRLICSDDELVVIIGDNGQGLLPEYQSGVGLQSMQERAAELNGRCVIESHKEGTRVKAWLPLAEIGE